ncbi:MAG: tRNA(His) guanylyltransferase Thg1 family protein [Sandaracinus sp.]
MKHDSLGARLKAYEGTHDRELLPDCFVIARIDGRSFSRLTKETLRDLEKPFDAGFRDAMIAASRTLAADSGFDVAYAYTQSDEISLLFARDASAFGRRAAKWLSILASTAAATLSLRLGLPATFDARLLELPNESLVRDYFRWRYEDAARNALSGHCYWHLRGRGLDGTAATRELERLSVPQRHELLHTAGRPFQSVPAWQRRGVGLWPERVLREGRDPRTGEAKVATRREWRIELELPERDAYGAWIDARIRDAVGADDAAAPDPTTSLSARS